MFKLFLKFIKILDVFHLTFIKYQLLTPECSVNKEIIDLGINQYL